MRKYAGLIGILGLAIALFGFATLLFTQSLLSVAHVVVGLGLLVTWAVLNAGRFGELVRGRALRAFAETGTTALLVGAVVIGVNLIASLYPKQFDLTRDGLYSLSEQTQSLLTDLPIPVTAKVFQQGGRLPEAEDLLKQYTYAQPQFGYEIVDPDRRPDLAERYEIRQNGTVILEAGGRTQKVTTLDEAAVTNGLVELLAGQSVTIGFVEDHGERASADESAGGLGLFAVWLAEANYKTRVVSLIEAGRVPDDIDVLVLAGSQKALLPGEVAAIEDWMRNGGALVALADRGRQGAAALLAPIGARLGEDVVIDEMQQLFSGPALGTQFLVTDHGTHPFTADFNGRTLWLEACSLDVAQAPSEVEWSPIIRSSPVSWGERDLVRLFEQQEAEQGAGDTPGPVLVGAMFRGWPGATTAAEGAQEPRGFVACDSDWLSTRVISQVHNRDFALGLIGHLAGQSARIEIGPKTRGMSRIEMTRDEMVNVFYLTVLIGPELLLLTGLTVWWRRRRS